MKKLNKKGFTIVELVIVIAVIAILAAVLIPTFSGVIDKAKGTEALSEVKSAYTATIADELSTPETTDDLITEDLKAGTIYVEHDNGKIIAISEGGSASIATGATATHKINDEGKIVAK